MTTTIDADLCFTVDLDGREVKGHLHGSGSTLRLDINDPQAFAGAGDAPAIRLIADELAARKVQVRVHSSDKHLVTLGRVRAPWWQRRATRSRHIRLGSVKGIWTTAAARLKSTDSALPSLAMVPPTTMWPIAPTFQLGTRAKPTTTHDPARGGSPRLVEVRTDVLPGERQPIHWLNGETTIGSDPSCDVVLAGLAPRHAVVIHDDDDEYLVRSLEGGVRVHGARVTEALLRTGARVEVGDHTLAFSREEFADHGRPFGGRVGGELGYQRPQPARST